MCCRGAFALHICQGQWTHQHCVASILELPQQPECYDMSKDSCSRGVQLRLAMLMGPLAASALNAAILASSAAWAAATL